MTTTAVLVLGLDARLVLRLAGAGQLALSLASLAIPRVLGWPAELAGISRMTRQVFWTYATYVCGAHVAFGLASLAAPGWFLDGTPLARAASGFVAVWWGARLAIALLGCERAEMPDRSSVRWAHRALLLLFSTLTAVYGVLAVTGGDVP